MTGREKSKVTGTLPKPRGVLQTFIILTVIIAVFCAVSGVLREKSGDDKLMYPYRLEDKSWDVVFIGSSHMNGAVHPTTLWSKYGITAYNNAQSGQILPVSYYSVKEVIERYHPKLIVMDLYELYFKKKMGNTSWMHQSLDTMSLKNRVPAVLDLIGWDKEFLFPFTLYHTRWHELDRVDFDRTLPYNLGCSLNFNRAPDLADIAYEEIPADDKTAPPRLPMDYVKKTVALCRRTGTELLLVTLPYMASKNYTEGTHNMANDQRYFNWMEDFAAEQGIQYVNYFHLTEALGFSWPDHMYNYSHMNYWGGEIITEHLARYIADHYQFTDRRGDKAFAYMDDLKKQYDDAVAEFLESAEENGTA